MDKYEVIRDMAMCQSDDNWKAVKYVYSLTLSGAYACEGVICVSSPRPMDRTDLDESWHSGWVEAPRDQPEAVGWVGVPTAGQEAAHFILFYLNQLLLTPFGDHRQWSPHGGRNGGQCGRKAHSRRGPLQETGFILLVGAHDVP